MSWRLIVFILWTVLLVSGALTASYYAWSPFSDEARGSHAFYGGSTHK
jgi:hypothetical protein